MKITQIKKLCVEAHMCMIWETGGDRQWIGTPDAIYPVDGLKIDKENVKVIFDMPDADNKMDIGVEEVVMCELVPDDSEINYELERWKEMSCGIPIVYLGEKLYPLVHEGGILFVRADFVSPAFRKNDYLVFKMTYNGFGQPLVMIGNGMETTGIVRPVPKKEAENLLDLLAWYSQMQAGGSPAKDGGQYIRPEEQEDGQIDMDEARGNWIMKNEMNLTEAMRIVREE